MVGTAATLPTAGRGIDASAAGPSPAGRDIEGAAAGPSSAPRGIEGTAGGASASGASRAAPGLAAASRLGHRVLNLGNVSIRWRLTIWLTSVLTVLLSAFSLAAYWYMGTSLTHDTHHISVERALHVQDLVRDQEVRGQVKFLDPTLGRVVGVVPITGLRIDESVDPFENRGVMVRVFDVRGRYVGGSRLFDDDPDRVPTNRAAVVAALQGAEHAEVLHAADGDFYAYTRPALAQDGRRIAAVQILTSRAPYDATMTRLARMLVVGTLLATVLSLAMGAAMAQAALAPIDAITRTARKINRARDLSRRIPREGPRDEVGRLADTVNEMLDRIEHMFERQRQFLADVSHELRTPLTTIRGEVDLISRSGHLDPQGLAAMRDESERMARLVNDLLLLARADSGLDVRREPVALDDLLADVHRQASTLAGDHHVVELTSSGPCTVIGDRDRLKQLLLILVDNAFKHTPAGTRVSLGLATNGDGSAHIWVSDNGPGIPGPDARRIFDRFYRLDKARSRDSGGAGLGLSIASWIAAAHGGRIEVESRPGTGAQFSITLPATPEAPEHRPGTAPMDNDEEGNP